MYILDIMVLAINIEDLLNKHKIEPNQIELKRLKSSGQYTIYAFANDDNLSNSYVLTN